MNDYVRKIERDYGTRIVAVALLLHPTKTDPRCPNYSPIIISQPAPARHHNVLIPLSQLHETAALEADQGFLTDTGKFLTRMSAKVFVKRMKQPTINDIHPDKLFSEDLW